MLELSRRAGIDPGGLSRLERGLQGASDDVRISLARALQMQVEDLFPYPDTTNEEIACLGAAPAEGADSFPTRATTAGRRSRAPSAGAAAGSTRGAARND